MIRDAQPCGNFPEADSTLFDWVDIQSEFVVINKAAGVSFHSQDGQAGIVPVVESSLADGKLYPVHRLDTMTSGLLLLARSPQAAEQINAQFRRRQVEKYYLALSDRKPRKKQGVVSGDMVKARRGNWKLLPQHSNPARTRFFSYSLGQGLRLYLLKPLTGRTHQLRVMMRSLGAPIIGDSRYYSGDGDYEADRGYLHAWSLGWEMNGVQYLYRVMPTAGQLFLLERVQQQLQQLTTPEGLPKALTK